MNRRESLERLRRERFDLLVIGGGITGCGVALDAAARGLKVALVERRDFAGGTSSRSSKLIHGGLRYLRQGQIKVLFESSREKRILRRLAPHLVEDLPFLLPFWNRTAIPGLDLGLWIYDAAAGWPRGLRHHRLRKEEVLRNAPGLETSGLGGAFLYHDARADDARLVMHVARRAAERGAVLANYTPVRGFIKARGRIVGARTPDFEIAADRVVNAAGVWADQVRALDDPQAPPLIRPTRGVHLLVPRGRLEIRTALMLPSPADGRIIFAIPAGNRVLVGTTDTDHSGDLDRPRAQAEDLDYLLGIVNARFPSAGLSPRDVLCTFAGFRALPRGTSGAPSAVSRDHRLLESPSGLLTITGGKLTTFRLMAEDVVDRITSRPGRTRDIPLGPGKTGTRTPPRDPTPLTEDPFHTWGEVDEAVEEEMAVTLSDVLVRRLRLAIYAGDRGRGVARGVAERMARHLGWDRAEIDRQVESFERELEEEYPPGSAFPVRGT